MGVALDDIPDDYTEEGMEKLQARIQNVATEAKNMASQIAGSVNPAMENAKGAANDLGNAVDANAESYKKFNEQTEKLNSLKSKTQQILGMAGAAKALSTALKNAFQTVKELDSVMAQTAMVTDFSIGDMWSQLPEYSDRANELGVSIKSAYESATLYYQQGLKTNEVVDLSNQTLKLAKIAGLDASEATDRMTAALRGFNMALNETSAQKVADVYSELAAITASDVDEISTAMTKTASIASSAGMEFETTAAFLSQIIETTRESAETAGTAMKTVIARFQELKKDPSEIGEIDGEIVDANAIETALRSVGVSLRDSAGQFRDLDDVFLELSSKWDSLDTNTQRYIATIAAGSRQQSRFIAMMQDYGRTQDLVSAANNSAGASQNQYEKSLESMESKLQQLKNAWDEFTMGIMNSSFLKAGVDALTALVNAMNKMTNAFGSSEESLLDLGGTWNGIFNSFSKIGTILGIFNVAKAAISKMIKWVTEQAVQASEESGKKFGEGIRKSAPTIKNAAVDVADEAADAASGEGAPAGTETTTAPDGRTPVAPITAGGLNAPKLLRGGGQLKRARQAQKENKKQFLSNMEGLHAEQGRVDSFVENPDAVSEQVDTAIEAAPEGQDLSVALQGVGNDMTALALPIDTIKAQFV
jgi:TP901 family phage tail tape measure protein